MVKTKFPCMTCQTGTTFETGTCDKCGAQYRRGELIAEGAIRKAVPIRQRVRPQKDQTPINFDALPWVSYQRGKSREEAIENMFNYYDAHPGRRRIPAREAFEVTYATKDDTGWILTVQRRKRGTKDEPGPAAVADEKAKAPEALSEKPSYEGKKGRHPTACSCSKHSGKANVSGGQAAYVSSRDSSSSRSPGKSHPSGSRTRRRKSRSRRADGSRQ